MSKWHTPHRCSKAPSYTIQCTDHPMAIQENIPIWPCYYVNKAELLELSSNATKMIQKKAVRQKYPKKPIFYINLTDSGTASSTLNK